MKLAKPTKDYTKISFRKEEGVVPKQELMSEDLRTLDLINDRSLQINEIGFIDMPTYDTHVTIGTDDIYIATVSVSHKMGYVPVFLAYYKGDSVSEYIAMPDNRDVVTSSGYDGFFGMQVYADSKKIYFRLNTLSSTSAITPDFPYRFKYYIFREELE